MLISELDQHRRERLLGLARTTLEYGLESGRAWTPGEEYTRTFPETKVATFVTLQVAGRLNGCIGSIEPQRPIYADVSHNAYQAAFNDPRFSALTQTQLARLDIHISVLSPLEAVDVVDELDLRETLRPGRDGLVLRAGRRRATFLPSVWDKRPDPADFVGHLKRKAKIGPLEWPEDMRVFRYEVLEFSDESE
jgi:hypothetical protein